MTETIRQIANDRSYSELLEAVEDRVIASFRTKLLMEPDEEFDSEASFFDLGLTSLRLTEIGQELQERLDLVIDASVMFNQPTVRDLVEYLTGLIDRDAAVPR